VVVVVVKEGVTEVNGVPTVVGAKECNSLDGGVPAPIPMSAPPYSQADEVDGRMPLPFGLCPGQSLKKCPDPPHVKHRLVSRRNNLSALSSRGCAGRGFLLPVYDRKTPSKRFFISSFGSVRGCRL